VPLPGLSHETAMVLMTNLREEAQSFRLTAKESTAAVQTVHLRKWLEIIN